MTWLRARQHTPIELPDIPRIDRREADIMFHAGYSLTDWLKLTDQERATIRWNTHK